MTRYEEPMTRGGMAVGISFLIIALLAFISVWIPELKPLGERVLTLIAVFWIIVFIFGGAIVDFVTWMSKY